jgi:hypothetical protein
VKSDGEWEIVANHETSDDWCKHCGPIREEVQVPGTPNEYIKQFRSIPRAVVAYNQGGYDCTIVCLDCIIEAAP